MNAFEIAWSVLKANTLPIRPKVMQYATDQKKTMGLEQTGGVARSARRKLMDEFQAEKNHDHPDSFSEGETDVMDQHNGRDYEEYYKHATFYDRNKRDGPEIPLQEHLRGNLPIDKTGTPEEIAERAMLRAQSEGFDYAAMASYLRSKNE